MRRLAHAALSLLGIVALTHSAGAQALGPQRQFLAIEPFFESTSLEIGGGGGKVNFNGYGGRLWINTDPFHFIPNGSIALFLSYAPRQDFATPLIVPPLSSITPSSGSTPLASSGTTRLTYGVEYDQFFVRRPLGGIVDPFLTVGYERYRIREVVAGTKSTYNGLPIGGGVRIPLPNRFELRGDAKDLILFDTPSAFNGARHTENNLLLQAALGLTF